MVRSSDRPIQVAVPVGWGVIVIEGHGEIDVTIPMFVVPDGTQVVTYQGVGVGLDDAHGQAIAQGSGVPARMPTLFDATNNEFDTDPGGTVERGTGGLRVYRGGEMCPNYRLWPYDHPGMGQIVVTLGNYYFQYDAANPTFSEPLRDIVSWRTGTQFRWACCTVIR